MVRFVRPSGSGPPKFSAGGVLAPENIGTGRGQSHHHKAVITKWMYLLMCRMCPSEKQCCQTLHCARMNIAKLLRRNNNSFSFALSLSGVLLCVSPNRSAASAKCWKPRGGSHQRLERPGQPFRSVLQFLVHASASTNPVHYLLCIALLAPGLHRNHIIITW